MGGRKFCIQIGIWKEGDYSESEFNYDDNLKYLYQRQIIANILDNYRVDEVDYVVHIAMDDPYLRSGWNHYGGLIGAAIGYAGVALNEENPTKTIVDRIGVRPLVTYESDIEAAVEYAEKRINQRGIDFTVR